MPDNIRVVDDAFTPLEEGTSITGGETFSEFAASMPDNARSGFGTVTPSQETQDGSVGDEGFGVINSEDSSESTPAKRSIKMSKKMKAAMKKIQDKVASFPILYFKQRAIMQPEWRLDPDEEEIIKDSLSFVFEILNIEFVIEQMNVTLTSIWWVIMYPVAAIGMVFLQHSAAYKRAHPEEEEAVTDAK